MKNTARQQARNQFRIIGGKWRGRKLDFPDAEGLRPTGDRIRETLFNWLMADLPDSHCLDLYCGAGALGFEAVSRGAATVVAIDNNRAAIDQLRHNSRLLQADNIQLHYADALAWLRTASVAAPFDLVFLDPPFSAGLLPATIEGLEQSGLLADPSLIYLETDTHQTIAVPAHWELLRQKQAGRVRYSLYRRQAVL